jgi:hypothetical protein
MPGESFEKRKTKGAALLPHVGAAGQEKCPNK